MNFIIHNYHTDQWWNFVRWCSDTEEEPAFLSSPSSFASGMTPAVII